MGMRKINRMGQEMGREKLPHCLLLSCDCHHFHEPMASCLPPSIPTLLPTLYTIFCKRELRTKISFSSFISPHILQLRMLTSCFMCLFLGHHIRVNSFPGDIQAKGERTKLEDLKANEFQSFANFRNHLPVLTGTLPYLFAPR